MPDTCPTIKIKDGNAPGGFVVINEEDFDEKKHTKFSEKDLSEKEVDADEETLTKAELTEAAEARGLTVRASMTKADIQNLLDLESGKTKAELVAIAEGMAKAEIVNALAKEGGD